MDAGQITDLLPLGGASLLLVYLLRVWIAERSMWVKEREQLQADHRAELAERDELCDKRVAYWRDRALERTPGPTVDDVRDRRIE